MSFDCRALHPLTGEEQREIQLYRLQTSGGGYVLSKVHLTFNYQSKL